MSSALCSDEAILMGYKQHLLCTMMYIMCCSTLKAPSYSSFVGNVAGARLLELQLVLHVACFWCFALLHKKESVLYTEYEAAQRWPMH